MSIFLSVWLAWLALVFLVAVRAEVVFRAYLKEINRMYYLGERTGRGIGSWRELFGRIFDLTKWTHKQFFPDGYRESE